MMFGSDQRSDIRIQRGMALAAQLLPSWEKELAQQVLGLLPNAELHLKQAAEMAKDEPERARKVWAGIALLYKDRPWAKEIYLEAKLELDKLGGWDDSVDSIKQAETKQTKSHRSTDLKPEETNGIENE